MTPNNALASHNGRDVEKFIIGLLGSRHTHDTIDTYIDGIPVEIKSCQSTVVDVHTSGGRRTGRFVFNETQHEELVFDDGLYALVVREGERIVRSRLVKAASITNIRGRSCSVTWKNIIGGNKCH